jgi:integrase
MKFEELAREYVGLNVFNSETGALIQLIAKLFVARADISECGEITTEALIRFKTATLEAAKPVTYNGYLRYLRLLGDYGEANNYLTTNWFRKIKTARLGAKQPKLLKDDGLLAVLDHLESNDNAYQPVWFWRQAIMVLYYTGIRRRQLVSLVREDVDLAGGLLRLRYESSKTLREWKIPLHPDLVVTMRLFIERIERELGARLAPMDRLFSAKVLGPRYRPDTQCLDSMRPRTITDFFKRLTKNSGVDIGAHKFRHTFATKLCNPELGEPDIFAVQKLLGHRNLQTTRGYVHTQMDRLVRQVNVLQYPKRA